MTRIAAKLSVITVTGIGLALSLLGYLNTKPQVVRAAGPVLYVAPGGSDTTNCTNSASPCASVQYAVDQADTGAEIRVAMGAYTGVSAREGITQVVYISKTVTIRGGYTATFVDPPNPAANLTTLDAQGQGRVLYIAGNISPTVEGLQITGGNAAGLGGSVLGDAGGGMYVIAATATLSNNRVFSNGASLGGGLYLYSSNAMLMGNAVMSNTAERSGGGVYLDGGDATIAGNIITANTTLINEAGSGGGGLYLSSSNSAISGNHVAYNSTASIGGGLYLVGGNVTLDNNIVVSNMAAVGGGLAGSGRLSRNTFIANSAQYYGGGLALGALTTLNGDIIISNTATLGGGLAIQGGDVTLTNTIVADNQATAMDGAGLLIYGSTLRLLHTTIARNGGDDGSGVFVGAGSTAALTNTIVVSHAVGITIDVGGMAMLEATLWGSGAWANVTDVGGAGTIITGTINVRGAPAFVNSDARNYHIGPSSAARDTGLNAGVAVDIDGDVRPFGAGHDIGADEFTLAFTHSLYLPVVLRQFP